MIKLIDNFKFCPRCQKKLRKIGDGLIDCPYCGFHYYLKPAVTNALILENSQGEILLTKRKHLPKKKFVQFYGT